MRVVLRIPHWDQTGPGGIREVPCENVYISLARIMTTGDKFTCVSMGFRIACASWISPRGVARESLATAAERKHQCPHRGRGPHERATDRGWTHARTQ